MKLYEISEALRVAIDGGMVFDEETGEILFDEENLNELQALMNDKLEACGVVAKEQEAEAEALKAEAKKLLDRAKVASNKAERLRSYMLYHMQAGGLDRVQTPKVDLRVRKYSHVECDETGISAWPEEFVKTSVTVKPNKAALKKAIADGELPESVNARLVSEDKLSLK